MEDAELNQIALDLLETVKDAARAMGDKTGRATDEVTAELLTEGAIRRPTDIIWLRPVIPQSPELAPHLLRYFPNEEWLKETARQKRGIRPKPKDPFLYTNEASQKRNAAEDRWYACLAAANAPNADHSARIAELCSYAEFYAGAFETPEAHRREQLIDAISAALTCLCVPDAGTTEPFEGTQPAWNGTPAGFDGYPYERLNVENVPGFDLTPPTDVKVVH